MDWQFFWRGVLGWTGLTLVHATALAFLTWILCATLLRRARPALPSALWTVVLIKFLVPPVLPVDVGLSSWLSLVFSGWNLAQPGGTLVREVPLPAPQSLVAAAGTADASFSMIAFPSAPWIFIGLGVTYLGLLAWVSANVLMRSWRTWRWVRQLPEAPAGLSALVHDLSMELGLKETPAVRVTCERRSPSVVGFQKATLILPEAVLARLGTEAKKALIIHELAHVRRGDLWVRWLQNLARTLFFFWPPVWWVCNRIEKFAEMACDQWAITRSGVRPDHYAQSLLEVVKILAVQSNTRQELAFARDGRQMEERFQMIFQRSRNVSPKLSVLMVPVLAGWLLFAFGGSVVGQQNTGEPETGKKVTKMKIVVEGDGDVTLPGKLLEEYPEADLNSDGTLTVQELQSFIEANPGVFDGNILMLQSEPGHQEVHVEHHSHLEGDVTEHLSDLLARHPEADINGDGQLDKAELDAWMESQGGKKVMIRMKSPEKAVWVAEDESGEHEIHLEKKIEVRVEDVGSLLQKHPEADLDGDGSLSQEEAAEFAKSQTSHHAEHGAHPETVLFIAKEDGGDIQDFTWSTEDGREIRLKLKGVSEAVDIDGDGIVSDAELELFVDTIEETGGEGMKHVTVDVIKHQADVDSQAVSEDEMRAVREKMVAERRLQLLEKYPDADTDGDGVLSKAEVESLVARLNAEREKNRVKKPN